VVNDALFSMAFLLKNLVEQDYIKETDQDVSDVVLMDLIRN